MDKSEKLSKFLKPDQVAELFCVKVSTVRNLCKKGKLEDCFKFGGSWLIPSKTVEGIIGK